MLAGMTVAVRVCGMAHAFILVLIGHQAQKIFVNRLFAGPDQLQGAGLHPFRPLCYIAQHQHGFSECGSLFLNPAAVRQYQAATGYVVMKCHHIHWFDDANLRTSLKICDSCRTTGFLWMGNISLGVREPLNGAPYSAEYVL